MARLYLDEDVPPGLAGLLGSDGRHHAVHAHDAGNVSKPDAVHLKYAADEGRTLVTFNSGELSLFAPFMDYPLPLGYSG